MKSQPAANPRDLVVNVADVESYLAKQAEKPKALNGDRVIKVNLTDHKETETVDKFNNYLKAAAEYALNEETNKKDAQTEPVEFFKPSDFIDALERRRPQDACADVANRLLRERGTVVYGYGEPTYVWDCRRDADLKIDGFPDTHTALLINIQLIQKEEPDSWEKIGRELLSLNNKIVVTDWTTLKNEPSQYALLLERARKLAEK